MSSVWNPEQYEQFRAERARPFFDLLSLVQPRDGMRVVDLGCGTGELTRELHRKLGAAETIGVDSSETMLAKCGSFAGEGLRFERADLLAFDRGAPFDLVFSNAALHWVADHAAVLERLVGLLAPGGQLAVQVPAMDAYPSHTIAAEVAGAAPFRDALDGYVRPTHVLAPSDYALLLGRLGCAEQHVRMQVYTHSLPTPAGVIEWVKGAALTAYEQRLSPELYSQFVARYRERLLETLPDERPFLFPYERILLWAVY